MLGSDVHDKTLGIIGLGRIGLGVAERALAFKMKVLYYNRTRKPALEAKLGIQFKTLDNLLKEADFISVHVPLTSETRNLIGKAELELMKPSAYLINTARGPIIDEEALVEALKNGKIKGAGLDVYKKEPTHNQNLFKLPNVVLTPHIGSATRETRIQMADLAVNNIIYGLIKQYEKVKIVNCSVLEELKLRDNQTV
jgi:lactate dehydrogenase-like 2-hydroxyacid dehydrogenase